MMFIIVINLTIIKNYFIPYQLFLQKLKYYHFP